MIPGTASEEQARSLQSEHRDNRRASLRLADPSQQMANTAAYRSNRSGYKGVPFHKPTCTWQAQI